MTGGRAKLRAVNYPLLLAFHETTPPKAPKLNRGEDTYTIKIPPNIHCSFYGTSVLMVVKCIRFQETWENKINELKVNKCSSSVISCDCLFVEFNDWTAFSGGD